MMKLFKDLPHHEQCKCKQCFKAHYDDNAVVSSNVKINRDGDIARLASIGYVDGHIRVFYDIEQLPHNFYLKLRDTSGYEFAMDLDEWNNLRDYEGE